ncbi:hypothetical protein AB0N07_11640 [Streptomyces sp. NPDC051172]|uniref:hypothetical protein n=1 Tax=Streptomyces sp. NPDC051172 TaxID=3155796 RepID=UPI00342AACDD
MLTDTSHRNRIDHTLHLGGQISGEAAVNVRAVVGEFCAGPEDPTNTALDTAAIRRLLNRSGLSALHTARADTIAEVRELGEALGPPFAVRWTDATGSPRTVSVRGHRHLVQLAEQETSASPGPRGPYVLEKLVTGPRFTADTLTVRGMHLVADVTVTTVAEPHLADVSADIKAAVRALLDLAGHECGEARTEGVLTPDGVRIAAVGRPGHGSLLCDWLST